MKQSDDVCASNHPIFIAASGSGLPYVEFNASSALVGADCVVGGVRDGEKTAVLDWRSITAVRNSVKLW